MSAPSSLPITFLGIQKSVEHNFVTFIHDYVYIELLLHYILIQKYSGSCLRDFLCKVRRSIIVT